MFGTKRVSVDSGSANPEISPADNQLAQRIVTDAVRRYADDRRRKIPEFVDSIYSFRGSVRLHRRAAGWDLLRAPLNVLMVPAAALLLATAAVLTLARARRAANWLRDRRMFLTTDVSRELEWRLYTELLELPYRQGKRIATRDALADEILADPRVWTSIESAASPNAQTTQIPADARARVESATASYHGVRAAVADVTNALAMTGAGAAAFHKLTPGALSLGPLLAATLVNQAAVASFPLGATLGGLWYGLFPAKPSAAIAASATLGLMLLASLCAAFAGIIADPIQRRLGIHSRRLKKLIDTLERNLSGDGDARLNLYDHYVSRLLDLFEIARAALR